MRMCIVFILIVLFPAVAARAGEADVVTVEVQKVGDRTYKFDVTVSHNDEGWNHYVNKWDVVSPDGTVLDTRTLHHPHVDEQPFTRSLSGVKIPGDVESVTIRAHDSVHEYGGKVLTVLLPP